MSEEQKSAFLKLLHEGGDKMLYFAFGAIISNLKKKGMTKEEIQKDIYYLYDFLDGVEKGTK